MCFPDAPPMTLKSLALKISPAGSWGWWSLCCRERRIEVRLALLSGRWWDSELWLWRETGWLII